MSIATFERRVSRAIKRGNAFDKDIPEYAKDAVRTLEALENWAHMWTEEEQTLAAGASTRTFTTLKTPYFVKRKLDDDTLIPLRKISSSQILRIGEGTPGGFWLSKNEPDEQIMQFDRAPDLDITLRYGYWSYSAYNNDLPWLKLDEGLLIAQTILEMVPLLRNQKFGQMYSPVVQAKVQFLRDAQTDAEFAGQDQRMVPFADEMDEYLGTLDYDW